ncbi:nucleopolyhedrovirus P10 family protein [Streptomyces sp. DSM 40750]|uniref:nucleopolyhedrovirus P10 family protein n=1 Tax=Streptomyces sp. DSM 40750 TaxID=2801030 RepID=UPI00214BE8AB|nr:nucleopolyhedrovirus P10 family protein [Streptomyces sp. DSM 40750]UUU21047.1 nucleopolyhedrovirus P10 family protein [Streptomyces sp. DSM 40750]
MTADGLTKAVRRQLGLGRILPLGGAHDGAWITESAAEAVLRRNAASLRGVALGPVRISLAAPETSPDSYEDETAVPPPPSALPSGPLRITADFAASAAPTAEPFPATATRLRSALSTTATERLGLTVTEVDLRVTALLEDEVKPAHPAPEPPPTAPPPPTGDDEDSRAAAAALSVPGVTHLTGTLGGLGRPIHIAAGPALPRRHVRVELAVTEERRALDVAREVRTAVSDSLPDHPSVAVLITAVTAGPAVV